MLPVEAITPVGISMNTFSLDDINALVKDYRDRCLWFLKPDYCVTTPQEALRALDLIEQYGDRAAYQRAEQLRKWLLLHSKAAS
jgi:hypothetical protein